MRRAVWPHGVDLVPSMRTLVWGVGKRWSLRKARKRASSSLRCGWAVRGAEVRDASSWSGSGLGELVRAGEAPDLGFVDRALEAGAGRTPARSRWVRAGVVMGMPCVGGDLVGWENGSVRAGRVGGFCARGVVTSMRPVRWRMPQSAAADRWLRTPPVARTAAIHRPRCESTSMAHGVHPAVKGVEPAALDAALDRSAIRCPRRPTASRRRLRAAGRRAPTIAASGPSVA